MQSTTNITTLFLDIGEVLLTNGWGHESRLLAADKFNLNFTDFDTGMPLDLKRMNWES